MKIFVAVFLAFSISLAEHNLTKELINKEMIKQITSPDEIKAREGYEKLCAEIVNDLKAGNDIEVLTPMSQKELWELKTKLDKQKSKPYGLKAALNNWARDIEKKDTTTINLFYDLGDDSYLHDISFKQKGKEKDYTIATLEEFYKQKKKYFSADIAYPHYSIRFNAMHKPIKYKNQNYLIQAWKSFDYKYTWNPSWGINSVNKNKILFQMLVFDVDHRNSEYSSHEVCTVKK